MNTMRAMQFFATPPTAGTEKIFSIQWLTVFEHNETTTGHFGFERLDYFGRGRALGRQVDSVHLGADGVDWEDVSSGFFDCLNV